MKIDKREKNIFKKKTELTSKIGALMCGRFFSLEHKQLQGILNIKLFY